MLLKQEINDDGNITNAVKYKGVNDDNSNKLLIDNINNALSRIKEDEMTNADKDNNEKTMIVCHFFRCGQCT